MDPLTILILRTVASTCIRLYITSMFGGETALVYRSADLGYRVPRWYMQAGDERTFVAYGTAAHRDEFESLADARLKAAEAMARHIRLANREIADTRIRYDAERVKQRRLVELFVRDPGLEDFIARHAAVERRQLVRVRRDEGGDMRAFVRLALPVKDYVAYQEQTLNALKTDLMRQKIDDIMAEIDAEKEASEAVPGPAVAPPEAPAGTPDAQSDTPPTADPRASRPAAIEPPPVSTSADEAFRALDALGD